MLYKVEGIIGRRLGVSSEGLGISLAMPLAMYLMHRTGTTHPPGGDTAFIAVDEGDSIHALGYWYVISPCLAGSVLMVLTALCVNNIPSRQKYPLFW